MDRYPCRCKRSLPTRARGTVGLMALALCAALDAIVSLAVVRPATAGLLPEPALIRHNRMRAPLIELNTPASGIAPAVDSTPPRYFLELASAYGNGIGIRVESAAWPRASRTRPSWTTPVAGDDGPQANAYFWAERSLRQALLAWSDPLLGLPGLPILGRLKVVVDCGGEECVYGRFLRDPSTNEPSLVMTSMGARHPSNVVHEFGHFFMNSYKPRGSFECEFRKDEGTIVNETMADVWVAIVTHAEDPQFAMNDLLANPDPLKSPDNRPMGGYDPMAANGPDRDYMSAERRINGMVWNGHSWQCTGAYDGGNPLKQMVWEILFGLNCIEDLDACQSAFGRSDYQGDLSGLGGPAEARELLIKALAYTYARLGDAYTLEDVVAWMTVYVALNYPDLLPDFKAIAYSHGFLPIEGPTRLEVQSGHCGARVVWAGDPVPFDRHEIQVSEDPGFDAAATSSWIVQGAGNESIVCFEGDAYVRVRGRHSHFTTRWSDWAETSTSVRRDSRRFAAVLVAALL